MVQPTGDRRGHYGLNTSQLCQALADAGHHVELFTNALHPERYLDAAPRFRIHVVGDGKLAYAPLEGQRRGWLRTTHGYLRNSWRVLDRALQAAVPERFDVLHLTGIEFLTAGILLRRRPPSIPAVMELSAANFSFQSYAGPVWMRAYKALQTRVFQPTLGRQIEGIAVLGEYQREALTRQLRLDQRTQIAVIPDGGAEPAITVARAEARKRLGLRGDLQNLFLFFGLLRRDKGIEVLLAAAALLRDSPFHLLLAGHPADYTEAEILAQVRQHGLDDKVIAHLGYIPEDAVSAYYFACDALVLPYRRVYSGGSGPLLKGACMHARPSIVTGVSEMGRLVREYGLGLVAPPEDPAGLAQQLQQFLAMPESERLNIGARARQLARLHSWPNMARRCVALYQDMARRRDVALRLPAAAPEEG